jgi:hypothetical protein
LRGRSLLNGSTSLYRELFAIGLLWFSVRHN